MISEQSFVIGPGHKDAQKIQKMYNKGSRTDNPHEKEQFLKRTGPQLPLAKSKTSMQVAGYEPEGQMVAEREMSSGEMKKEKSLKSKYDKSGMKASMVKQYGPEKGKQVYFATIRKQAMANSFEPEGDQLKEFSLPGTGMVMAPKTDTKTGITSPNMQRKFLGMNVGGPERAKTPLSTKYGNTTQYSQQQVDRYNAQKNRPSTIKTDSAGFQSSVARPGFGPKPTSTAAPKPASQKPQTASAALEKGLRGVPLLGDVANIANKYDRKSNYRDADPEIRRMMGLKNSYELKGSMVEDTFNKTSRDSEKQVLEQSFDYEDAYSYILEALVSKDYAESYEAAEVMFEHISDEFTATILEEYIEEKARGTRKKTTVHAYDVDETLFGHGKKGKPNVQVHVKDASGKRVKSLSNQEFNTHKLEKGHSYDFSEFQSAKKFKETSSPNKKVIKDIKRKQARGQNVHLITARSKFDKPSEFQGHLKKHGIDVDKSKIHYTGGMKGGDIGKKKVDVANAVAKQSGAKKIHMYDDAAKVHKAFEKEKKEAPTTKKIKTHMVAPDKKGESRVRSYQATKNEEMTAYDYWKQFIH